MYGEVMIAINMIFNISILTFTNRIGGFERKITRLLIASFIGAFLVVILPTSFFTLSMSLFLMTICAFGMHNKNWLRSIFIILIASFFAGGLLTFIHQQLMIRDITLPILLLAVISISGLFLFERKWLEMRQIHRNASFIAVSTLHIWGKEVVLRVFVDSGNSCTEPLSNLPVHFVAMEKIEHIMEADVKEALTDWDGRIHSFHHFPQTSHKDIRLIELQTIQGTTWTVGFRFDKWFVHQTKSLPPGFIVFTKQHEKFPNGVDAILHVSTLDLVLE